MLCLIISLTMAIVGIIIVWIGINTSNWPHTEGTISSYQIQKEGDTTWISYYNFYRAYLTISYTVGGVSLTKEKKTSEIYRTTRSGTPGANFGIFKYYSREEVDDLTRKRYPLGTKISVFYSPKNPEKSIIDPRVKVSYMLIPVLSFFFLWLEFDQFKTIPPNSIILFFSGGLIILIFFSIFGLYFLEKRLRMSIKVTGSITETVKYCPKCFKEITISAEYCRNCGAVFVLEI
ncbi:MAG: DUF3592 domain-containing protein [Promethearchaeota archaeon]